MSSESGYFKLGLFVLTGVALIVGGIVFFGAGALFREYFKMETATTNSVEGLNVGAAVKFNGVTVGKVSSISMATWKYPPPDPAKRSEVARYISIELEINRTSFLSQTTSEIRKNLEEAISRGLRARMASSGLTGPPYIEVVFLDPKANPPTMPPWKPEELYIPSAPSTMTQVITSVTDILQQVQEANIPDAVKDMRRLINNTNNTIVQFDTKAIEGKAVALIDEVRATNKRVHQILDNPKIDPAIDSVAGDLPQISSRLRDVTAQVDDILRDPKTKQMLVNLQDTSAAAAPAAADARRILRELDALLSSQSQDLEAIVADLRRVLQNTAAVTAEVKSNPSRMLFGEPPPHITPGNSK